ncbi:MAG: EscI/YscI/HrpB family type III secretion system inner rod protein [Janthinobacterium lividum]
MNPTAPTPNLTGPSSSGSTNLQIDSLEGSGGGGGDPAAFRAAFERQQSSHAGAPGVPGIDSDSLSSKIASKMTGVASEVQKDQKSVSKMLEKATSSGDSMQLMRAMMALNDYQLRVQTISKVVAKASTSIDSLTKLQ